MNIVKPILLLLGLVAVVIGFQSAPAMASDGGQQLRIKEDWVFSMRGDLRALLSQDGITVTTNNLSLTVLDNYQYAPLAANYITIDLVNRNPGQKGWNVLATTREIKFGRVVRQMDRGDAHRFSFTELIPYKFPTNFRYGDHWLVLTVSTSTNGSSGTVHAHTEKLFAPQFTQPSVPPPPAYERVFYDGGAFERSINGKQRVWVEKKKDSAIKFQFIETERTNYWITLYDPIRKLNIRLPRREGRISESTNGRSWRDLYDIRIITAAPEKVTYDGGAFERFDGAGLPIWYETGKDYKPKFMFVETERKSEQITIFDVTRNFTIRLPTIDGMIALSVNNGVSWRDIYKALPQRAPSTRPIRSTPQEVMFTPSFNSMVAHSGSATLTSTGPFLVLKFSDYLIRTDDRNQGNTTRVVDIRFRLVSKKTQSDGTRLIRESEPFPLNLELTDRISRSVLLPDIKIPLDGIPFDELGQYLLVSDLRIRDGKVGVPSDAYPSIDPSRLL